MHQQIMIAHGFSSPSGTAPFFVAATSNGVAGSGTLGRAWPAGYTTGDLGIVAIETGNSPVSAPSGWDLLGEVGVGTAGVATAARLTLFGRIAVSGTESQTFFSTDGSFIQGRMFVFRGVPPTGYVDAFNSASGATSTTITLPGVTTTGANRLVLHFIADGTDNSSSSRYSNWTNAGLTSLTELGDAGTNTSTGGGYGLASGERAAAGATGSGSVDFALAASNYVALTLALKPA